MGSIAISKILFNRRKKGRKKIVPFITEGGQSGHFLLCVLSDAHPVKNIVEW